MIRTTIRVTLVVGPSAAVKETNTGFSCYNQCTQCQLGERNRRKRKTGRRNISVIVEQQYFQKPSPFAKFTEQKSLEPSPPFTCSWCQSFVALIGNVFLVVLFSSSTVCLFIHPPHAWKIARLILWLSVSPPARLTPR